MLLLHCANSSCNVTRRTGNFIQLSKHCHTRHVLHFKQSVVHTLLCNDVIQLAYYRAQLTRLLFKLMGYCREALNHSFLKPRNRRKVRLISFPAASTAETICSVWRCLSTAANASFILSARLVSRQYRI